MHGQAELTDSASGAGQEILSENEHSNNYTLMYI